MECWVYRGNHHRPGTETDFGRNYWNAGPQTHPGRSWASRRISFFPSVELTTMVFPSGSCPPLLPLAMSWCTRTCWQSTLCVGNSTERPLSSATLLITTWCVRWSIPTKTTSLTKSPPVTRSIRWNSSELVVNCDEYGLFSRRNVLPEVIRLRVLGFLRKDSSLPHWSIKMN